MSRTDFLEYTRAQPFVPFRIQVTDGSQYEIRHPDMALATLTSVVVGIPGPAPDDDGAVRRLHIAMEHVVKLEALPASAPPMKA